MNHFLLAPELLADALRWPRKIRSTRLRSIFVSLPFTLRLTLTSVTEMRSPCITVPLRKTNVSTVNAVNSSVPSGASLKLDAQDSGITPQVLPIAPGKPVLEFRKEDLRILSAVDPFKKDI